MTLGVNVGQCMPTLMGKGIEIDINSGELQVTFNVMNLQ